jgi:hypothetical protein
MFWLAYMPKTQFEGIWPNGLFTMIDGAARKVEVHFLTVLEELIVHGVYQTVQLGKSKKEANTMDMVGTGS